MDENKMGIDIPINVSVDSKDVNKVLNDIINKINTASENNEFVINVKTIADEPIKGASDDLLKAQKDLVKKLNKLTSSGYSATEKDLNGLLETYQRFRSLVGKERKGNSKSSKIAVSMLNPFVEEMKAYKKLVQSAKPSDTKTTSKRKSTNYQSDDIKTNTIQRKKQKISPRIDGSKPSSEQLDKYVSDLKEYATKEEQKNRIGNKLDFKSDTSIDYAKSNARSLQQSEFSPYENKEYQKLCKEIARLAKITEENTRRLDINTYKVKKEGTPTSESEARSINLATMNKTVTDMIRTLEKYNIKKQTWPNARSLNKAIKYFGVIPPESFEGKSEEFPVKAPLTYDTALEETGKEILSYLVLSNESGRDLSKALNSLTNALERIYDDNPAMLIGGTNGNQKGVGKGHEWSVGLRKTFQKLFGEYQQEAIEQVIKKEKQLSTKRTTVGYGVSTYSREKDRIQSTDEYKKVENAISALNNDVDKIYDQETLNSTADYIANSKQGQHMLDSIDIAKTDSATGFNTDIMAYRMLNSQEAISGAMTTTKEVLGSLLGSFTRNEATINTFHVALETISTKLKSIDSHLNAISKKVAIMANTKRTSDNVKKNVEKTTKQETKAEKSARENLKDYQVNALQEAIASLEKPKEQQKIIYAGPSTNTPAQNDRETSMVVKGSTLPVVAGAIKTTIKDVFGKFIDKSSALSFLNEKLYEVKNTKFGFEDLQSQMTKIPKPEINTARQNQRIQDAFSRVKQPKTPKVIQLPADEEALRIVRRNQRIQNALSRVKQPKTPNVIKLGGVDDEYTIGARRNQRIQNALSRVKQPKTPNVIYLPKGEGFNDYTKKENSIPSSNYVVGMFDKATNPIIKIFEKIFDRSTEKIRSEAERVLNMNSEQQDALRAERLKTFGVSRDTSNLMSTGDVARINRTKDLFFGKRRVGNEELFQNLKLTPGVQGLDVDALTNSLESFISNSMFSAQVGGTTAQNILGSLTFYTGMPSLEKSRAQVEGLNQILSNIRNDLMDVMNGILDKESTLRGMEAKGEVEFDTDGNLIKGSSAARQLFSDMEEQKLVLEGMIADIKAADQIFSMSKGKVSKIVKLLSFSSPILMKNNKIIKNINAGLDKNGKALRYTKRIQEIMNYTFQLMARNVGQMFRNWLNMLNPINLIKKAFSDFANYDVKWQRTMNVIKYNLQTVIRPFMQWIAQKLVNIIGFFDIILQKIQSAFGGKIISLFDQGAANAEKIRRELEEAANVSASFDELHDIGVGSSENAGGADNLLGEIYKPELSEEWKKVAEDIGELFKKVITGDMGFGDVMKLILKLAWDGLVALSSMIWNWFKETSIGKWLVDNWAKILREMLLIFLGWQLLKIAAKSIFDALFGWFTIGNIKNVFEKIGLWITSVLGGSNLGSMLLGFITSFVTGMKDGLISAFTISGGGLIGTLKTIFTAPKLITGMKAWGSMLGSVFAQAVGVFLGVKLLGKAHDIAADNTAYNVGLEEAGGDKKDKKSNLGANLLGAVGGGVLGAFLVGGPLAIGIGAIAGLITTALVPAVEAWSIKQKEANNEMQKIEYYQGKVKAYSDEVNSLTELENLSTQAIEGQTDKIHKLGEKYGVSSATLQNLIKSIKEGNYTTQMSVGLNDELVLALDQLNWQYNNNEGVTNKLIEAKRKLQKAEMDLAIAEDIAAGNFELASARIEVALASNVYTTEEAVEKMVQVAKKGSVEQANALLRDMSPELKDKFQKMYSTTDSGLNELTDMYYSYSKNERKYFLQSLTDDVRREMEARIATIEKAVEEAPWYQRMLDWNKDGKIWGKSYVDIPGYATGTNYVPSDGLAYLHQGEAVIPKKYNQPYQQPGMSQEERAYMERMMYTMNSLDNTMKQGINVNGQFTQRGSDLVAVVNKAKSQAGAGLMSNPAYAR